MIDELDKVSVKHGIHKGGEGGEYETFVLDGPIFKKRIDIKKAKREWDGVRGSYIIEEAELAEKN
jgi:diphthamide synthase (EF-2-diphthine--ammonia ligase)